MEKGNKNCNGSEAGYIFWKRFFDLVVAVLACAICIIPMGIIAVCVVLDSKGPALLKQERMGQYGKAFKIYKFRTMYIDAPNNVATSLLENPEQYITPVGHFLRKTSLDELPQLFNVLIGNMSFVGFRPVCLTEKKLNKLRMEYGVFKSKPGITGLAQVRGRDDIYYRDKAKIDAEYVQNRSLKMDAYCLFQTIPAVLTQRGVK